jgi:nitrite reductase (NADH) small subunit
MTDRGRAEEWHPVCRISELEVDRGVSALVHGQAVAIFRTGDDAVYALGNHDPFARQVHGANGVGNGIARGIVGRRGDVPFVASPAHRHAFDLRTGRCLDDEHVSVPAYDVRVVEGVVLIGHRKVHAA